MAAGIDHNAVGQIRLPLPAQLSGFHGGIAAACCQDLFLAIRRAMPENRKPVTSDGTISALYFCVYIRSFIMNLRARRPTHVFSYFRLFYAYLGDRIFLLVALSMLVGLLDGFGIALFIPLLETVAGGSGIDHAQALGRLRFLLDWTGRFGLDLDLSLVLALMMSLFLLKGVMVFLQAYLNTGLRARFMRRVRLQLIEGLRRLSFTAFTDLQAGRIQNTLSGETLKMAAAFVHYFSLIKSGMLLAVYLGLAVLTNARIAALVVVGGLLSNLLYRSIFRRTKQLSRRYTEQGHLFEGLLIQSVHFFKYLKATRAMQPFAAKMRRSAEQLEEVHRRMGFYQALMTGSREVLVIAIIVAVILIQVRVFGGQLAAVLLTLLFLYRGLNSLINLQGSWNGFLNHAGALDNFQDFTRRLADGQEPEAAPQSPPSFREGLALRNLRFTYPGSAAPALQGVDLSIPKNETLAITGPSGAGKTTLANVLAGLLLPERGALLLDGHPLQPAAYPRYRERVGYITQESVIFSDTVFHNVTLWDEKTDANLARFREAVRRARLEAVVRQLPRGEDSLLGDRGIRLSGGQRQRVAIARELYRGADILILDEATSALDAETEEHIRQNLEAMKGACTIILIAHRLSSIRLADRIVLMEAGRIASVGDYQKLLAENDAFRRLAHP